MGDRHDYVALEWVKGEIAETLKQARQALEAYVEAPQDSTRMRFCMTYVHQVHGTLQMVEFFGAALLAEEMEQLARALLEERVANRAEALEVLMQAILQMPVYLDRIQSARRDLPMVVLPRMPAILDNNTTEPSPFLAICGNTILVSQNVPFTLVSMILSQASSAISAVGPYTGLVAALQTSTSIGPQASFVLSTRFCKSSFFPTWQAMAIASKP